MSASRAPLLSRPQSLTTRLVATAVGLVALVSLLFSGATAFALDTYLDRQLDRQVMALNEDPGFYRGPGDHDRDNGSAQGGVRDFDQDDRSPPPGRQELAVRVVGGLAFDLRQRMYLEDDDSATLADVAADGRIHDVMLTDGNAYRVVASIHPDGDVIVTGVRDSISETVKTVLSWMGLFVVIGIAAAAAAGLYLVRRQLRPLREVADTAHTVAVLPLASGEVDITARVPARLTDERTEVGQVGAALNTLLGHVESALGARHRSEQQVRQFVADASHELRTPLATIQGYAELARRTHAQEPAVLLRALEKVEAEGVRMTSLVEDLLLLARLDAGRPLAHDDVDLTRLVLEAVSDARVVSPDHRWRLQLPDDPVSTPGDQLRLRQVLVNLLSNAARHTPAGTTVTVTVSADGADGADGAGGAGGGGEVGVSEPWATVQVHDDGPGIPEALQPSVFERFTRADTARTREVGGAGLGLSLAQAITRAHRGDLTFESRPGSTTFALRLPAGAGVPDELAPATTYSR